MRKSKRIIKNKARNAEKAIRKKKNAGKLRRKREAAKKVWPYWLNMNGLFIFGFFLLLLSFFPLLDSTFISWKILIAVWLISGVVFTIPSFWVAEVELEEIYGRSSTIEVAFYNCVAIGGILTFSFMFINFMSISTNIETHQLKILEKRTHKTRRGDVYPSALIEYKGLQKSFSFSSLELEKAENASHLIMKTKKGNFGFDVVIDKKLSILK